MILPPFASKLQIRSMDEDEDLAVIDQVNRRLAMGQLEPTLPWVFVPSGAGLLGYSPNTTTTTGQYAEAFVESSYPPQPEPMSSPTIPPSTQYFFPMETGMTCESTQFNPVNCAVSTTKKKYEIIIIIIII